MPFTDALGWGENQNYRAALFIDAHGPNSCRGTSSVGAHTPYSAFKHRPKCNIYGETSIGDIPARIYDVDGLSVARAPVYECYHDKGEGSHL